MYDYAQLYAEAHAQVVEDIALYRRIAGSRTRNILELACGTGRVACALAADGHTVTGIDSSADMLSEARRRASGASGSCTFLQGDMRSFEIPQDFDLILLPLNGCAHLYSVSDLSAMFETAARHLSRDGRFVCHLFRFGSGLAPGNGTLSSRGSFESRMLGGEVEWYESRTLAPDGEFEYLTWYFVPDTPRDATQLPHSDPQESQDPHPADTVETELTLRIYSPRELVEAACEAGLVLTEAYTSVAPDWFGVFSRARP